MGDSDTASRLADYRFIDLLLGAVIMGTVGTIIGLIMGHETVLVAAGIGIALGAVVGILGGRRFLISILIGTALGGALAWALAGVDKVWFGAGAGAAIGGFLGVQVSMLSDLWAQRKRTAASHDRQH